MEVSKGMDCAMAKTEVWLTAHQVPSVPDSSDSESVKRSAPRVDQLSSFVQTQTAHFFLFGIYEEASELVTSLSVQTVKC